MLSYLAVWDGGKCAKCKCLRVTNTKKGRSVLGDKDGKVGSVRSAEGLDDN